MVKSNEKFGLSCEKAICEISKDHNGIKKINEKRVDRKLIKKIKPAIKLLFKTENIKNLTYIGYNSNKVDFIDSHSKTYSIKSNRIRSYMVAPQNIGQSSISKFNELVYSKLRRVSDPDKLEKHNIREWIIVNIKELLVLYYDNLLCCDYLIYIKERSNCCSTFYLESHNIGDKFRDIINSNNIFFTRSCSEWNESNTVKVEYSIPNVKTKYFSIGEFQLHKNRDCIKFRFNINSLCKIIYNTDKCLI